MHRRTTVLAAGIAAALTLSACSADPAESEAAATPGSPVPTADAGDLYVAAQGAWNSTSPVFRDRVCREIAEADDPTLMADNRASSMQRSTKIDYAAIDTLAELILDNCADHSPTTTDTELDVQAITDRILEWSEQLCDAMDADSGLSADEMIGCRYGLLYGASAAIDHQRNGTTLEGLRIRGEAVMTMADEVDEDPSHPMYGNESALMFYVDSYQAAYEMTISGDASFLD